MVFVHGLKLQMQQGPARIAEVETGSPAAASGLAAGQQILSIDQTPIHAPQQALSLLLALDRPGTAVNITTGPPAENHRFTLAAPLPRSRPVHPAQLYGSLNGLLLCLLLLAYDPFRRRDGELLALALTIYPITRFLLEAIRTDELAIFGTGMSISQNVSLLLLLIAAGLWWYVLRQPRGVAYGGTANAAA